MELRRMYEENYLICYLCGEPILGIDKELVDPQFWGDYGHVGCYEEGELVNLLKKAERFYDRENSKN